MINIVLFARKINFGLKSIIISLSITKALRPWLFNDPKYWALALKSFLLIIPDTHIILSSFTLGIILNDIFKNYVIIY